MASTARHRASTAPLTWAARSLVTATTVPVGALAGCVVAAVAATAQNPGLGVVGLAAAGVPLTLSGLRARHRARRGRVRGRHVAGLEQVWPTTASADEVLEPTAVRLDPAVDVEAPSPAAFRALELVPVAPAAVEAPTAAGAADVVEVVRAAEREEATVLHLPQIIPSQRAEPALERDAEAAAHAAAPVVRAEVVVHVAAATGEVAVHVGPPASEVAPEQRALEIAQLKRLWAVGTGPDTGSLRAAAPAA
ncbi:hypothetical protein FHN55_02080 [Streptomyces sp. NP160]|uniref:hypothetical protein n=1 Tax=Streptomyces sp. NP160 TaxID=2586637 RepID=UPI0011186577|nr:hypothetical protein [Streptomyces sp. NP160]TNM69987.1 hypothetical protein FHN55_02080 [Streptomyces sp. NP160]